MALTILRDWLNRMGLEGLIGWASGMLETGASEDEIAVEIYDQPEFISRFPAIRTRAREGLPMLSVNAYLEYEAAASQLASSYGITVTKAETDTALKNDQSIREFEDRIGMAATLVYRSSPEFLSAFQRMYNVSTGDLVRYWLNPKEESQVLQRRFVASQIAGQAAIAGYKTPLSAAQAESLVERGLSPENATEAFGTLVETQELFEATDVTEEDIDVEEQLALITGDTALAQEVSRRGERRRARFEEGGGFAETEAGISGLGTVVTQ